MLTRFAGNPFISPADVTPSQPELEVMCAFNPGATSYNGQTVLLVRVAERPVPEDGYVSTALLDVEQPGRFRTMRVKLDDPELDFTDPRVFTYKDEWYLTSISHLRLATSSDGRTFTIADRPTLMPDRPEEEYGIEDPRITFIDGWYYINYSAISRVGVCTSLARTKDFVSYEKLGIIFGPDNKDIAIFPEKIGGQYYCFHRPSARRGHHMWLASSPNLLDWGHHRHLLAPRPGYWDAERVGCGAQPIKTAKGWLHFHHGSSHTVRYCTGAVLLDLEEPWKVIARDNVPLLEPTEPCAASGFMPNVVFHNGLVDRGDGTVDIYYGAADEHCAGATVDVNAVLEWLGV